MLSELYVLGDIILIKGYELEFVVGLDNNFIFLFVFL